MDVFFLFDVSLFFFPFFEIISTLKSVEHAAHRENIVKVITYAAPTNMAIIFSVEKNQTTRKRMTTETYLNMGRV